ncbi:restriction endonuclease subunit S [Roseibium aggregatum]|uniref:restriction endonuclease subunit S n=1 Tax=Roseibium aggregatum TaxID=187304 RepID=UPI001E345FC2|nr:restriction endonuclease subunit S [Roseibium aggregatum]UES49911.1 hypothetical protein GFK88_09955 [Roseibium aggregatum]
MTTMISLGDAFEFIRNGMNVKQSKDAGGVPITRIETISDGAVDMGRVGYAGLSVEGNEKWLLEPGDLLLSHINSVEHIGKCAMFEGAATPLIHGMNLLNMRPKQCMLFPRYAMWALKEPGFRSRILRFVNKAVNQASISTTNLKNIEIPLPPLAEQKRIAEILDQAARLVRLRQQALDKLNTLGQAIFHEMFGNLSSMPTRSLSELVRSGDKINYGVVQPGEECDGGVPLLRAGDVLSPDLNPASFRTIAPSVDEKHRNSRLKGDEILIACVGSIGAVSLAHSGLAGVNIARAVARVPVDASIADRRFVAEQLKTSRVQNYFKSEIRLVAQPTLNIKQISSSEIFLPPLQEQKRFSEFLDQIDEQKKRIISAQKAQESLFHSIQHRAFLGEL